MNFFKRKTMTPEELQEVCAKLGYPWVAMDRNGSWTAFSDNAPRPDERYLFRWEFWTARGLSFPINRVKIAYKGLWTESLRGPKK